MFAIVTKLVLIAFFIYRSSANKVNDRFYPYYHLAPPYGWMNDPNGFCVFEGEYHLFYQFNPVTSQEPGIAHWGHAKSQDLFNWIHLPIAMYPDKDYDKTGVFSGSAVIDNNTMYLLYTGNVNHPGENPDHTQRQALAYSSDGVKVTKYPGNPVILGEEHQPNIRDPKVWKHGDTYYMVLGNSFKNNTLGRVLIYLSKDLISWQEGAVLDESDGFLGYMWECPDFFELDGKWILLFSPQGVKPEGDKYKNLYQTGYIVGDFEYESLKFTPKTDFKELDHGHDFYATQTILDESGRRILIAWQDMWEQVYPERNDSWAGLMVLPRTLHLTPDLELIQKPIKEIEDVRCDVLHSGKDCPEMGITLTDNVGEINIEGSASQNFELVIEGGNATVTISYDCKEGKIALDRGGSDGLRRTAWKPDGTLQIQIFIDRSSIEVFCGKGEVTFSSRFFPCSDVNVKLGKDSEVDDISVYSMKRTVPKP